MFKKRITSMALAGMWVSFVCSASAQFADFVVSYTSGTGVSAGYTDPASLLGQPSQSTPGPFGGPVDPFDPAWQGGQLVSVGTGGTLTVHLDTPVYHDRTHP